MLYLLTNSPLQQRQTPLSPTASSLYQPPQLVQSAPRSTLGLQSAHIADADLPLLHVESAHFRFALAAVSGMQFCLPVDWLDG
ncbi:hypothetical protein DDI_3402 [Dickeya dianthicola RNS04.9]|nr:hypothetical protein DDI_3402 [Dickeya dianthicola RNS04.9]